MLIDKFSRNMNSSSLVCIEKGGQESPIFVVPAAGSTPFSFVKLAHCFKNKRPIYTFEFAGLMSHQPRHTSIDEMASHYIIEIQSLQANGPYLLGGHCFGGIIALEIASKLEIEGEAVAHLVLLESLPPQVNMITDRQTTTSHSKTELLSDPEMQNALKLTFNQMHQQLSNLPENLAEKFRTFGWEQIEMGAKHHVTTVNAPITLLHTDTHPAAVFDTWLQLSNTGFSKRIVPGDTFTMLGPPFAEKVAEQLERVLSEP